MKKTVLYNYSHKFWLLKTNWLTTKSHIEFNYYTNKLMSEISSFIITTTVSEEIRPKAELIIFKSIQITLLLVRLLTLMFFTFQTVRHVRFSLKSTGRINTYTLGTVLCLGLSFLGFFVYRGLEISLSFAESLTLNTSSYASLINWEESYKTSIFITKTVFRHISYCL